MPDPINPTETLFYYTPQTGDKVMIRRVDGEYLVGEVNLSMCLDDMVQVEVGRETYWRFPNEMLPINSKK